MTQSILTSAQEGQGTLTLGPIPLEGGRFGTALRVAGTWNQDRTEFTPVEPRTLIFPDGSEELLSVILESRKHGSAQA